MNYFSKRKPESDSNLITQDIAGPTVPQDQRTSSQINDKLRDLGIKCQGIFVTDSQCLLQIRKFI